MASYQNTVRWEEFRGTSRRSPTAIRPSPDEALRQDLGHRNTVPVSLLTADVCGEWGHYVCCRCFSLGSQ